MRLEETNLVPKLLVFMTGCMALLVAMFAYLIFSEPKPPPPDSATQPPPPSTHQACDLSRPDGDDCADGTFCLRGRCEPIEEEQVCQRGEGCLDCECDAGLLCHQARCRDVSEITVAPADCRDPKVADAVFQLKRDCDNRDVSFDELKSMDTCTANQWEKISLKDKEQFGTILSSFKNRFTVHFPPNEPTGHRSELDTAHFLAQIARLRGPLAGAKQIFVIGRASPDGNAKDNYRLALRRMDMVTSLIERVVHGDTRQTERSLLTIRQWSLRSDGSTGGDDPLTPSVFRQNYLSTTLRDEYGVAPTIAHDLATEERLMNLLERSARGQLAPADERWLLGALNRVVIVVPIPCDGSEVLLKDPVVPNPMIPASTLEFTR